MKLKRKVETMSKFMFDRLWKCSYWGFHNTFRAIIHVENIPPHWTMGSTYEGVSLHFNESLGNGLYNPASEREWILWLRIWQCHFHTLRKWWFYTCWLSPCVKRLFHHCQQQYGSDPHPAILSCCRGALSQQTNVTRRERSHCCVLFCEEYQSNSVCFLQEILYHSLLISGSILCHKNALDKKGAHLLPDSQLEM